MSLKSDCKSAIYFYASQERQNNSVRTGEHSGYVGLVLILLRNRYHELKEANETTWSIPDALREQLDTDKPY